MGERKVRIDLEPEVIRQIATRKALGASIRELEKEFNFSRVVVNRALDTDLGKSIQKEVLNSAVAGAVIAIKRQLADMTELAMKALENNLKNDNMEAVKTFFKALGLDDLEKPENRQQQGITVILPGQAPPIKDIEV